MPLRFPPNKHPGPEYVYVICDVCGRKIRRKDTVVVKDQYNFQNNLVVCKWDVDKTNPQNKPFRIKEKLVTKPEYLRSEPSDTYAVPTTDNRTPSAPRKLVAKGSTLGSTVELFWQGPIDTGSSRITGYKIERAEPQLGNYDVITSNSGSSNNYYNDTSATVSSEYTYRIYAINGAGTGAVSEVAYYPHIRVQSSYTYLGVSQNGNVLKTGQGDNILLSPDV